MTVKCGDIIILNNKLEGMVTQLFPRPLVEYSNGFVEYLDLNNLTKNIKIDGTKNSPARH